MNYVVYRDSDGSIVRAGKCPDDELENQALTGETAIEGEADDTTQYVYSGIVSSRPEIAATWDKIEITANGSDTATLGSSLPNPTIVFVSVPDGAIPPDVETVTTGIFEFATPIAGTYTLIVTPPFPYQPHTQIITAI